MSDDFVRGLFRLVLPRDGLTPKYVVQLILFLWTHLPTQYLDFYVLALGVLALGGLDLFMSSADAMRRVFIVGLLLLLSQHMIPTGWQWFKQDPSIGLLVFIGGLYLFDYALATGGWESFDKK